MARRCSKSLAIIEYLDETYPNPPLLPKDPKGRARVRGLAQIVAANSHPLIVPRVREYLAHEYKLDEASVMKWAQHWHGAALTALEAHLKDGATGKYAHGDQITGCRYLPGQPGGGRRLSSRSIWRHSRPSSGWSRFACRMTRSRGRIRLNSPARRRRYDLSRVRPRVVTAPDKWRAGWSVPRRSGCVRFRLRSLQEQLRLGR